MNWDSSMGDFLIMVLGTLVFVIVCLVAAKIKGEI